MVWSIWAWEDHRGNRNDLNQVSLKTYAVPQAMIRFDENKEEIAQPVPFRS